MTGLYRRREASAARKERSGGFTGARRTGRCPKSRSGWPVVAARREQAVGGGGERRRRRSGEGLAGRKGGRAARGRGEARCGAYLGGAALEWRGDGGFELAGVRWRGGGVPGCLGRERARGRGEKIKESSLVLMRAREKRGGLCPGRATAASRWRPAGAHWARGAGWRLQREGSWVQKLVEVPREA